MTLAAALGRFVRRTIVAASACLALAAGALPAAAQPAFWVIKDADSTIYLLGTIHLLKPDTGLARAKARGRHEGGSGALA